jgi:hypothetical protein
MLRTLPETINTEIDLYIRTYYSLLRSSEPVRIRSLEDSYSLTKASLHPDPSDPAIDVAALTYAVSRLPSCIHGICNIVLGQSEDVFRDRRSVDISSWQRVYATARRRKMFFDGESTLACFISSVSDIDDLIPILTAFQIEWNKIHYKLASSPIRKSLAECAEAIIQKDDIQESLRASLELDVDDFDRLCESLKDSVGAFFCSAATRAMDISIHLLAGALSDYRNAVQNWWRGVISAAGVKEIFNRGVYFVSSNPHAIPNLFLGYETSARDELIKYLYSHNPENLVDVWEELNETGEEGAKSNLLYYILRDYLKSEPGLLDEYKKDLAQSGIYNVDRTKYLDVGVQVIEMNALNPGLFDKRISLDDCALLEKSKALIINIDYPLGMAAYHLYSQISANMSSILGIYITGKAATLNGRVGDVMLPNVVFDEHSKNTYLFKNCFDACDVNDYLNYGTVFDNQKSVTVRGTLLQNNQFLNVFYQEGYTDLEMEAGPYLSAIYEDIYPQRYPKNEIVNLFINAPFDIGIIHYASDTPYGKRENLLSKSLSYFGVDATYATSVAVVRRILATEIRRLKSASL